MQYTQQNSYSTSHYAALLQHNHWSVTVQSSPVNCQPRDDYTAVGSSVTVLLAISNGDYTVTVQ